MRIRSACTKRSSKLYNLLTFSIHPERLYLFTEPVFKIFRWKIPVVTTESTILRVDSRSRLFLRIQYCIHEKRWVLRMIQKGCFKKSRLFMVIVITKKRMVDPTLLHKWVYINSGKWIQKESTKKKSMCSVCPPSSKTVLMNTGKKSRPHFFVLNTGSGIIFLFS